MIDHETLCAYAERAHDYAARFAGSGPSVHLANFMRDLPKGGRVLDLGCGPGQAAAEMKKAGFEVDAWDASPEMATVGRENFDLEIETKSFDALDAVAAYDGIYANFSLLHAPKAEMPHHLARVSSALKPGGLFHVGLKVGDGEQRDRLGRFYAFYQDAELTALLNGARLLVTSRAFGKGMGLAGTEEPWMIMRASKKE